MKKSQISVVIPAYRCGATLAEAIDSALIQDVELEIIVINDSPEDDLDGVMERYSNDGRVIYVQNEKNMGAAASRNRGVNVARGEYVAFLDADDYWMPGKLHKQLEALQKTDAVLCCTARELMSSEGVLSGKVIPVREIITYRDLLQHNSISCSSVIMRTETAREFPMHHEDSHEDYIMWLEILKKYGKAAGINEPLMKYRVSDTGKSGSKLKSARMTFRAYRYMGFGLFRSLMYFVSYAVHGVMKHYLHW